MTGRTAVPQKFQDAPPLATGPQMKFLLSLLEERDLTAGDKFPACETEAQYEAALLHLREAFVQKRNPDGTWGETIIGKRDASRWIERLLTLPQRTRERTVQRGGERTAIPSADDLPTGNYAVNNEEGELRFYRLWRGTRNPNYVKLYVQHGPSETEVPFKSALTIIKKIVKDGVGVCAVRYGLNIGECSKCKARLTNRISRALRIGPICGGRFWSDDWNGLRATARDAIRAYGLDPDENVEEADDIDYAQLTTDVYAAHGINV